MPDLLSFLDAVDRARPVEELPPPAVCRRLRQEAGLPLHHVAVALGAEPSTIATWERGLSRPRVQSANEWRKVIAVLQARVGTTQ